MDLLGKFPGRRGEITVLEDLQSGGRFYYEAGVYQSCATRDGLSHFAYVHLMAHLLERSHRVLLFGCAAGSLATMLCRKGKQVTLVDDNPISFEIARDFFGLPEEVICIAEDCSTYVRQASSRFDGIGIDVGGPGVHIDRQFGLAAYAEVRSRLVPKGRIVMNMIAAHDVDPLPDRVLAMLAGDDLHGWIHDQPGEADRNIVLSAVPEKSRPRPFSLTGCEVHVERIDWRTRRQRLVLSALLNAQRINAGAAKQQEL